MQVADTVVVQAEGKKPENCTAGLPSKEKDVIYMIQNEEENDAEEAEADKGSGRVEDGQDAKRRKALRSDDPNYNAKQAALKERQSEILKDKNKETLLRLTEAKNSKDSFDPTKGGRRVCTLCFPLPVLLLLPPLLFSLASLSAPPPMSCAVSESRLAGQ